MLPTLKTARELKREVYHLSLSTLTQTAGEPVQDFVEGVWDVAVWYSAFRKPIKLETWAGKIINNNNNNNNKLGLDQIFANNVSEVDSQSYAKCGETHNRTKRQDICIQWLWKCLSCLYENCWL